MAVATTNAAHPSSSRRHSVSLLIRLTKQMIRLRPSTSTSSRRQQQSRRVATTLSQDQSTPKLIRIFSTTRFLSVPRMMTHNLSGRVLVDHPPRPSPDRPQSDQQSHRHRLARQLPLTRPKPESLLDIRSKTGTRPKHQCCCSAVSLTLIRLENGSSIGPFFTMDHHHPCQKSRATYGYC